MSTCSRRVALYLYEKKIPFEYVNVDMFKGEHKAPDYVRDKHPFGQVPAIDDDGLVVYESRGIIRYLEAKYTDQTPRLAPTPSNLTAYAHFEQAASVELSNFDPLAGKVHFEKLTKPHLGLETNEKLLEEVTKSLDGKLNGYEAILSKQKYLAGDEYTLADLFHIPYGDGLVLAGYDLLVNEDKRPNVARWYKDISSRPAWTKVKEQGIQTTLSY